MTVGIDQRPRLTATRRLGTMALLALAAASAPAQTWIGRANGTWSNPANWLNGVVPTSSATTSLLFTNSGNGGYRASNDLGTFLLNNVTFRNSSPSGALIENAAGSQIRFEGPNAFVLVDDVGLGRFFTSASAVLNTDLRLQTTNYGSLFMTGPISEVGGSRAITVVGNATNDIDGKIFLEGANSFTGGVTLQSGNLRVGTATSLGTGVLTVQGGTFGFRPGAATVVVGNSVSLQNDFRVRTENSMTLTGVISGAHGLDVRSVGNANSGLTLQGDNTYTGATVIDLAQLTENANTTASLAGSSLTLSGANGAITGSNSIDVRSGSTFEANNLTGVKNRIADGATVTLQNADFRLVGNASAAVTERVGKIIGEGFSRITIDPRAGGTTLSASEIERVGRATFLLRGTSLGNAPGANVANILVDTAPTLVGGGGAAGTTNMSIVAHMIGGTTTASNGTELVTYGVNGFRNLASSEYVTSLAGAAATSNVKLSADAANNDDVTVNALVTSGNVTGTGTLRLTSGVLLNTASRTISNNLAFGTAEGQLFTGSGLTVSGVVSGTNGITKSGISDLTLTGVNTYSGATTVNAGRILFNDVSAFGASDRIDVNSAGGTTLRSGLRHQGVSAATLNVPISVNGGYLDLSSPNAALTVNGPISGTGGIIATGGTVRLNGTNTYTGQTRVFGGVLEIANDAALGAASSTVHLNGLSGSTPGGIRLLGDWTTDRTIYMGGGSSLDTNGFDAEWNGPVLGGFSLEKLGAGTLTIQGGHPWTGSLDIGTSATSTAASVFGGDVVLDGVTKTFTNVNNGRLRGESEQRSLSLDPLGILAPGLEAGDAGTMATSTFFWINGGRIEFDLGAESDRIRVINNFAKGTLSGFPTDYTFVFGGRPGLETGTYTLVDFGATTFAATDFSYVGPYDGFAGSFLIEGNQLRFRVESVPEPGTLAALGFGALALLRRRQARKSA